MKKSLKITLSVVCALVVALGAFLSIWFWGDSYKDFEQYTKQFNIPAMDEGFVPQGMGNYKDGEKQYFFMSGYMKDNSPARIYLYDGESYKYVTMQYENGDSYNEHACGVATNGTQLWLVSPNKEGVGMVFVMDYKEVLSKASQNGGVVKFVSSFNALCGADFCYYDGQDGLFVGEFYREGNYETPESHRLTTPDGTKNPALAYLFEADATATHGVKKTMPVMVYSIPERIQGIVVNEERDTIVLSQSYGLSNSAILIYNNCKTGTITIEGEELPLKYLEKANNVETHSIPAMSEGLCNVGNDVYVLFENAAGIYKYVTREKLYQTYSFELKY